MSFFNSLTYLYAICTLSLFVSINVSIEREIEVSYMKKLYRGNKMLTIVTISMWITWVIFLCNPLAFSNYIQIKANLLTELTKKSQ